MRILKTVVAVSADEGHALLVSSDKSFRDLYRTECYGFAYTRFSYRVHVSLNLGPTVEFHIKTSVMGTKTALRRDASSLNRM